MPLVNRAPIDPVTGLLTVTTTVPTAAWPSLGGMTYDPATGALAVLDAVPGVNDPWNGGIRFTNVGQMYVTTVLPAPIFYVGGLPVSTDGRMFFSSSPPVGSVGGWPIAADGGVAGSGLAPVGPVPIFFAPLTNSLIPTTAGNPAFTFTRATLAYAMDQDGILRQAQIGEARFQGARRVRNLLTFTDFSAGWTIASGTKTTGVLDPLGGNAAISLANNATVGGVQIYQLVTLPSTTSRVCNSVWVRRRNGTMQVQMTGGDNVSVNIAVTSVWQRFSVPVTTGGNAGSTNGFCNIATAAGAIGDALDLWAPQMEVVDGQSNQAPGEYVSVGVLAAPYHGNAVDGVQYFATTNGNNVPGINLVLWSQDFDNAAWTKQLSTITANTQTAPDGTLTADTFADNATSGFHQLSSANILALTLATYTYSIYLKQGTATWVQMVCSSGSGAKWANFNLATGAIGAKDASTVAAITPVGNGWYRCSIAANASATANVLILGLPSNSSYPFSYAGSGQTVHLWGSQFAAGSSPIGYNPTTTTAGVTSNVVTEATGAAIPAATMLGYVAENSATTLALQSQTFDVAPWVKTNGTATANTQAAPDGTLTADTFAATGVNGTCSQPVTATAVPYTFSVYLKRLAGTSQVALSVDGITFVDVTAQVNSSTWSRVAVTLTPAAGTINPSLRLAVSGDSVYLWGAQVEQASDPSSYIPTTTAAVTRTFEQLLYPVASNLDGTLATTYTETYFAFPLVTLQQPMVTVGAPTFYAQYFDGTSKALSIFSSGGATPTANIRTVGAINKNASAWGGTTRSVCLNGGVVGTGAFVAQTFASPIAIGLGQASTALGGTIRNVKFYNVRIADVDLVAMTGP